MNDNLVFFINKLSYVIVCQDFENCSAQHPNKKDECSFNKCLKKVRQIGCDVLLKKTVGTPLEDPCVTDYGGNWSPLTLITDYGRELQAQGAGKYNDFLLSCLKVLEEKQYDSVNEILKFLLLLKKPVVKEFSEQFQKELSFSGSEPLLQAIESDSFTLEDCPKVGLSRSSSHKKALQYEESWTKHFDAKFQLLGEFSKKNLAPDKVSLNSLFSSRPIVNSSQSRSNSFVFPDFSSARNYSSEKSLFDINSNTYLNDSPLLDNFVDHPITHRLPALSLHPKFSSKSGFLGRSSLQIKAKFPSFPEEAHPNGASQPTCALHAAKPSVIELKRNSNCSHSFAILYEKSARSQASSSASNDSLTFLKAKRRLHSASGASASRDVILGLWEQEQTLLREFKPELATDLPALRMITLVEYIEDVKYLFTGINSGTFSYDPGDNSFSMVYGTCLDDVTPESLYDFSKDFLEIGNCYVRLSSCVAEIGKNNFDTCTTISQAFWKSIFDFLELHYSLVLDIPFSVNLLALKACTKDLHEIITTVARICKVFQPGEPLPRGGQLLTYLLGVAEKINKQSVLNILFGILQNCCSVYFMCILQNWMFKGRLEDQGNEFFVDCRRQKVRMKSRAYYNSFWVSEEKVPSFLRGYEESVYNCGKSIHFLRQFNAENKLCQMLEKGDYPSMCVCFSEEELSKLEREFRGYEERVARACGERRTMRGVMEQERERERAYLEYVREWKVLQEEKRERERVERVEEARAAKERQRQLLSEQRRAAEAEKERRREEEEAERLRLEEEVRRAETQRENMVNQEKSLLKSYYEQVMGSLNKELRELGKRGESLRRIITGATNEADLDAANDNSIRAEGKESRTSETDVNSNASMEGPERLVRSVEPEEEEEAEAKSLESSSAVVYDENSNPSVGAGSDANANAVEPQQAPRRSASQRTVAAEEAERNRCKVLRSEFGLPVRRACPEACPEAQRAVSPEPSAAGVVSEAERNKWRVLDSEYNLLKRPTMYFSLRSVTQNLEMGRDGLEKGPLRASTDSLGSSEFETVGLERKAECMNLERAGGGAGQARNESTRSDSSDSFLTPSNEQSAENVSNACEEGDSLRTPRSSSMILNEKYRDALTWDMNVFYHKVSHQHIFCSLKDEELASLPCTDFMMFQRYLRKSALIPLKVQERLANDALLKHLLEGENLLSHLSSLRGYFFLNDGEFGRSFTHHTFRSLARCTDPNQFFERSNLSNIVNEALNYTIHNCEPNSQNLSFRIVRMPPYLNHSSHDVLSPFELSYKVDWPLSIILTEKALAKYKTVFRFLLKLKRINWTLNENFLHLNSHFKNKRLRDDNLAGSPHYHKIQIYRHAMTQVMITLDDYIFSNGVQFPWMSFLKDLETTENIDHLYQKHVRYIKDVLTRCFLSKNSQDLLDCIHSMIELALKFHYTAKSSALELVDGRYEHPKFPVLKNTFSEFCAVIKVFLRTLKEKISSNQVVRSHYVLIEKFDLKLT